jgi:parallel beta-helix repeat protein
MVLQWVPETSLRGPKGDTGATGPTGDQGPQGVQGLQGLKGDTGAQGVVPGWVPVTAYGATGNGTTDDTAAIQAAIDAAPAGSVVWFPAGTYRVSATIRLAPRRSYLGPGGRPLLATIKAAPGLTGGAVVAAQGWWNSATVCDDPIRVEGLVIDGSSVSGVHGLVVYNFWSHFEDLHVRNINTANAVHVTDRGRNGTTITTNSHSENTFVRLRVDTVTGRGTGFRVETNTNPSRTPPDGANQDGHLLDSFFAGISGDGIRIQRAAGWSIENNHLYGIGYNGIALGNCYATKVQRNYLEEFGGADGANNGASPTWGYFTGILLETVLNTRASVVADNTVSVLQPSSPVGMRWTCYSARAGSGQMLANLVAVGNTAVWANGSGPATSRSEAWRLGEPGDSGRRLAVEWAGNQIQDVSWWQTRRVVAGSSTVVLSEPAASAAVGVTDTDFVATFNAAAQ